MLENSPNKPRWRNWQTRPSAVADSGRGALDPGSSIQGYKMFYTYVLLSEKDKKHYIGQTENLKKRLSEHNKGKVKSTKYRRPLKLIHFEEFDTKEKALLREKYYKTQRGRAKLKLL